MLLASFFSVVIQPPMAVHVCWHVIPPSSLIFLLNCSKLSSFILSARLFIFSFIPSASLHNFSVKSGPPCSRMSTKTNVEGGGPVEAEVVRRARPQRSTVAEGTMVGVRLLSSGAGEQETPSWSCGEGPVLGTLDLCLHLVLSSPSSIPTPHQPDQLHLSEIETESYSLKKMYCSECDTSSINM